MRLEDLAALPPEVGPSWSAAARSVSRPRSSPAGLATRRASIFIANRELFGDVAQDPRFAEGYQETLTSLREHGAPRTLEALVAAIE